jgi:hypothetical protein
MTESSDPREGEYSGLQQVPFQTFRDFATFIVDHNLWDEAIALLRSSGLDTVAMGRSHVDLICSFIDETARRLKQDPANDGMTTPQCSLIKRPPKVPKGGPDGGAQ